MSVPGEQLDPPGDLDLRQHLAVLRRRWLLIVVTTIAFVALVVGWTIRQTPVYESRAQVLVRPQALDNLLDPSLSLQARDAQRMLETELVLARSSSVSTRAEADLDRSLDVTISGSADADVITFVAAATDPDRAADDATGYARAYIAERDDARRSELLAAQAEVQAKVDELQGRVAEQDRELADLEALIAITPVAERGALDAQREELEAAQEGERQATESQLLFYQGELDRLQVATDLTRQSGARLIQEGQAPSSPSAPKPTRDAVVAALLGLMVGIGLAFLRDHFDDSLRTVEDVKQATGGLPVLSTIPTVAGWKADDEPCLVTVESPSSPAAEAYRKLRTDVQFLTIGEPIRQLVVTSARPGDGKTTTVANLAVMFARAGKRVIVAACDLRRPRVHTFLGVPNRVGFTSVLLGDAELIDALQPVPNEENLVVLTSGPEAPNPSELLGSAPAQEILARLAAQCDLLIIDCPPVLPVSDALVLARQSDSTLLVCRSGVTRRGDLARSVEQLEQVSASIAGVVLNAVDEGAHGSGYRYGYGYTDPPAKRGREHTPVEPAAPSTAVTAAPR